MALCPELERSLSLLQPGADRARQQQERRADAAPTPMVFMCAGCGRPVGDTRTWGSVSRTAVPSCCARGRNPTLLWLLQDPWQQIQAHLKASRLQEGFVLCPY
ncbi:uncharacterized protein LOC134550499 isoform X4 [Prinia subflava]|uniref:uncharacterized protein LOC134550499 isoform X4 n=1 Tax=Prinia subflava TaxID=208062 RepID=UPI002FE2792D